MPAATILSTPHEDVDQVRATVAGSTPSMTTWRHDTNASLHRNRRLAIVVIVLLCLLFLLAIVGIILYASRRRQSSRHRLRGRHESVAEPYRDDYIEPDESPSASPNPYRDFTAARLEEHHPTPTKRSDDALSMITEMPTNSVRTSEGSDRGTNFPTLQSPTLQSRRLPSSISSHSQTLDALESPSDDDLHGNLSGLDEDPFVDRTAISGAGRNQELSKPVSPLSQPLHSRPRVDTAASSSSNRSATSDFSQAPITAINTGGRNGANMDSVEQGEERTTSGDLLSTENIARMTAIDTRDTQDTPERGRGRLRSDPINTARSSSVSTRQSRLRAADVARSPESRSEMSNSRSPQAETSASIDDLTEAVGPRSSNHPPPPPLLDRNSWLGERRRQEEGVPETTSPLLSPENSKTHEESSSIDGK